MKKFYFILFIVLSSSVSAWAQKAPDTLRTRFIPESLNQSIVDRKGQPTTVAEVLQQYQGKVTLLYVWAAWCPDCLNGFPAFKQLQKRFPNLEILNLSRDRTETQWKKAIDDFDLKGAHYWFGSDKKNDFTVGIDLNWIPRYLLIDQKGHIAHYYAVTADDEALIKAIELLIPSS